LVAAAAWSASVATVGQARSGFDIQPSEINLSGVPGSTLVATFLVTSPTDRVVVAATVTATDAPGTIPAATITITPDRVVLLPGLAQTFRVSVVAPSTAGASTTTITLNGVADPDAPAQAPVTLSRTVTVNVTTQAAVPSPEIAVVGSLKATRVACTQDCWVAERLLPPAERLPTIPLVVQNTGTMPATLSNRSILAVGDRTGAELTTITLASPSEIPAGELEVLDYALPSATEPDRYVGQAALALDGVPKPVVVPVDITVRRGPAVPLALLTVGLIAGWILRQFHSRWIPLGDASARFRTLLTRLATTPLAKDERGRMLARMEEAQGKLREGHTSEASTLMDGILGTLQVFDLLHGLLVSLVGRDDPNAKRAGTLIAEARTLLFFGAADEKPDVAAATLKYEQAYVTASADPTAEFVDSADRQADMTFGPNTIEPTDGQPAKRRRANDRGEAAAVLQDAWLGALRILRIVVRGLLIGLALIAGMVALYVAPTAGFIGNTPADVAALLFWGFGSGWVDKVFIDWG
jgi:hypothetical protein